MMIKDVMTAILDIASDATTGRGGWRLLGVIPAVLFGACMADPQEDGSDQTAQNADDTQSSMPGIRVVPLDGNHHLTPEQVGGQIAPDDIISGQKVLIISKGRTSQKCLDVTGGPGAVGNGVLIQMWDCLPGFPTNQQWEFFNHNSVEGSWQIRAVSSGKCLDVRGVSQANAALVQQWDCTGGANQRWSTEGLDSGIVGPLVSENSGKCLDVQGGEGDKANGTPVQQFDCLFPNGILVTNQTWFRGTF